MKVIISFGAKGWWVRAKVSNSDLAQDQGPQASWVFFCLFVFGFFETGFLCVALAVLSWNSLCRPGWLELRDPPASASQVLGLKACTTMARHLGSFD